jgi:hypothetical protein
LRADHVQRGALEFREVALGGVLDQQAVVAAVVGFAHGGLHAHLGGDAGKDQMRDALQAQDLAQRRGVERALARLHDDDLARQRREFGHDVVARFAIDEDAPHGAGIADAHRRVAALALGRRAVGEVGTMRFAGVNHRHGMTTAPVEQAAHRGHDGRQQRHVVAQRLAEAARLDEIALHVDDDQRGVVRIELVDEGRRRRS